MNKCWDWDKPVMKKEECNSLIPVFTNNLKGTLKYCDKVCEKFIKMPLTELKKMLPSIPKCKQAVFGLFEDLAPYIVYSSRVKNSPFIILTSDKWTPMLNKKFVSCALDRLFEKACTSSLRILLTTKDSRYYNAENKPRIALLELCIVAKESNKHKIKLIDKGKNYDTILLTKN